jgi:hypothetical protein
MDLAEKIFRSPVQNRLRTSEAKTNFRTAEHMSGVRNDLVRNVFHSYFHCLIANIIFMRSSLY